MPNKMTQEAYIQKAKAIHGDKYDYSLVEYINGSRSIKIVCPVHGVFEQNANSHLQGRKCKRCAGRFGMILDEFAKEAAGIHNNKYHYASFNGVKNKAEIVCPEHGSFWQVAGDHLQGHGCLACSGKGQKNTEYFIAKAKSIHGDRYDYSKAVYTKSDETVVLVCSEHGEFKQRAADHLAGKGCSSCSGTKKLTQDEFLARAVAVHGDKYDYKHVFYVNGVTKVKIVCAEHGEFLQTPTSHLGGHGCIVCGDAQLLTTEEWIKKAVAVHGDKYDYSEVEYRGQHAAVKIKCSIHGMFEQRAGQHTHLEAGCPFCAGRQVNEINCLGVKPASVKQEWNRGFGAFLRNPDFRRFSGTVRGFHRGPVASPG